MFRGSSLAEFDKCLYLCGCTTVTRLERIKRESFVGPIRKQLHDGARGQKTAHSKRQNLSDADACDTGANH